MARISKNDPRRKASCGQLECGERRSRDLDVSGVSASAMAKNGFVLGASCVTKDGRLSGGTDRAWALMDHGSGCGTRGDRTPYISFWERTQSGPVMLAGRTLRDEPLRHEGSSQLTSLMRRCWWWLVCGLFRCFFFFFLPSNSDLIDREQGHWSAHGGSREGTMLTR